MLIGVHLGAQEIGVFGHDVVMEGLSFGAGELEISCSVVLPPKLVQKGRIVEEQCRCYPLVPILAAADVECATIDFFGIELAAVVGERESPAIEELCSLLRVLISELRDQGVGVLKTL